MNEHVENYCVEYIESEFNPHFAILLKGEWGCGKTYFINKLISRYTKKEQKIQKNEIVYISLFGISQISEIDDRLFQKMHPILSSEKFKFATGFIRSMVKAGIKIGTSGTINIGGFELKPAKLKKEELEKKLIIVDDIERADLSQSQIFGYFSEYLNQLNMRIIFIGNEEKIEKEKYLEIKEKTIGAEFTILPEIEVAVDSFIKELLLDKNMEHTRDNCLEAISILNCNNLRTVRQCLYNLKLLYMALNKDIIEKHWDEISKIFINLFIQKSLNKICNGDQIRDSIVGFNQHKMNYTEYIKMKEEKKLIFDYYNKYVPLSDIWSDIIFNGNFSKKIITESYQKDENIKNASKQKNLFILMSNWRNMTKQEFKSAIDNVKYEFENGIYLHPGEILLYANFMMIFSEYKLINETKCSLVDEIKEIVNKLKKDIIPVDDWTILSSSYTGWRYSDEFVEIQEIRDYIKDISIENFYISLSTILKDEINRMKNDIHHFNHIISHEYYGKPFLYLIDIDYFFSELVLLSIDDQLFTIYSLKIRYENASHSRYDGYKKDKENLLKLTGLYERSLGEIEYNPPELLKRDILAKLHELIEYFNL